MHLDGIINVCDILGLDHGPHYRSDKGLNISISCPLAPWTHGDPHDANMGCSVLINDFGPSLAHCFSLQCGFEGTWYALIQQVFARTENPSDELRELVRAVAQAEEVDLDYLYERAGKEDEAAIVAEERVTRYRPSQKRGLITDAPRLFDGDVLPDSMLARFSTDLPGYVAARDIRPKTAEAWGLLHDERLGRLVFPVRRFDFKLVGLTGRILPDQNESDLTLGRTPTKYHNYTGLNKSRYLFGAHMLLRDTPTILVEGPFDALKTWQALAPLGVAATLGQGFTGHHRRVLKFVAPSEIYVFTDLDAAGRALALKIVEQIGDSVEGIFLMKPQGQSIFDPTKPAKDPGEMSDDDIRDAFVKATPILGADISIFNKDPLI